MPRLRRGPSDQLIPAMRLVHANLPIHENLHTIVQLEIETSGISAKDDHRKLGRFVFQRKIKMSASLSSEIGYFTFYPTSLNRAFQKPLYLASETRNGMRFLLAKLQS